MPSHRNESECRRPGWTEGRSIILGDGQSWTFPRPRMRFYPVRDPDTGRIGMGGGQTFGDDYADLLDSFVNLDDTQLFELLEVKLRMASHLLLQNYDLDGDDLRELLAMEIDCPESVARWTEINEICLGIAPKPLADGSATPSLPTG